MTKSLPTLAFVGTGMMGQLAHLANYAQLRNRGLCTIAGVTDLKTRLAQAVADAYHVPRVYTDIAELLADSTVDAVVCIQQWPNNYPLVKKILQAGKSVLTEKPMVGRSDEAEELTALAKSQGVLYAVGFMKRYDTGVELAKKVIAELQAQNELGPLLAIDALCNGGDWTHNIESAIHVDDPTPLPPLQPTYPAGCQSGEQRKAYNYLINIYSHNINLCHYFLDATLKPHYAHFLGDRGMQAILRSDKILVTLRGMYNPLYYWSEHTILTFDGAELTIKTPTPLNRQATSEVLLTRKTEQGYTTTSYHPPIGWAFFRQAEGFIDALAGRRALRTPAEEALKDVHVMEELIEIAKVL